MKPTLLVGDVHKDSRGSLYYNNIFDLNKIKRIYYIESENTSVIRAWQGHKIEQRWFSAVHGSFNILLIQIDSWEEPNKSLEPQEFILSSNTLDVLHIPEGYVSSIQALEESSKLLVMADYLLGELNDEYKYPQNYFE
jgi:dTDP-4-dehydrorhamnose 3,5-epimerase-like enzyme